MGITVSRFVMFFTTALTALALPSAAQAIAFTPFAAGGFGGSANGQTINIGTGGTVAELDGFINILGLDLNGAADGTSAQFSVDHLPTGLDLSFNASLRDGNSDLLLSYELTNTGTSVFSDLSFLFFLDAEIDEPVNSVLNEYGAVSGSVGAGAADPGPDRWEIDESGFAFSDIFDNLLLGTLDNGNGVPLDFPEDVAMALEFLLGDLAPTSSIAVNVMISEDGDSIGPLILTQHDTDPGSSTVISLSGGPVPAAAPPTPLLMVLGSILLAVWHRFRTGAC